jgi:hypothetical protein
MDDHLIRCSGNEGRCERSVPRSEAETVTPEQPPWVGRNYMLDREDGRWTVFVNVSREVESVRCPECRDSIL